MVIVVNLMTTTTSSLDSLSINIGVSRQVTRDTRATDSDRCVDSEYLAVSLAELMHGTRTNAARKRK